ncbi:MAG: hypothetical protein HOF35_03550 [Bacteroidetes bacterium]|nr:hypothetical protein [Bacteroidota bacterium]
MIKNPQKVALTISTLLFLFFSYGHVFSTLKQVLPNTRQLLLMTSWLVILFIFFGIIRKLKNTDDLTKFITIISIVLFAFQLFLSIRYQVNKEILNYRNSNQIAGLPKNTSNEVLPDIYYIILDAHTSSAVLNQNFGYDNSEVISELEELGFYHANCSQTNYWRTVFSVYSALNINYLDEFLGNPSQLPDYEFSYTLQFLDNMGYQMVKFETKADHNQNFGEDIYLARQKYAENMFNVFPFTKMNDFEAELIQTTWLQPLLTMILNFNEYLPSDLVLDVEAATYYENYNQILFMLEELGQVPYLEVNGPKLVYAHFLVPHEPYIFHPSGRYEWHDGFEEYHLGYANNAEFIDSQLPALLEKIIDRSEIPPIIIVQGDHGPNGSGPKELLPILNLYYLPNGGDAVLYPTISPVNTFRVIFNHYFNSDFELLEDISYYGKSDELKEFNAYQNFCLQTDQ